MLAVSALAPAVSYAAATSNNVNSITVPGCIEGVGISGTLDVTVTSSPFVFDIWVTDHKPGESDFVEIPGSRVTLSISSSSSSYAFGPLDVTQHRDGVNTYRVESGGSTAKSASIHPCDGTPPSTPPSEAPSTPPSQAPSTPPSEAPSTPPSQAPSEAPSAPPSEAPSTPPSTPPSQAPSTAPSEAPSQAASEAPSQAAPSSAPSAAPSTEVLPIEGTPQPTGEVEAVTGTPRVTPPPTDTISDATSSSTGSWRIVLAGLAILIAIILVATQPTTRVRRTR
jgi:hypothetical protein